MKTKMLFRTQLSGTQKTARKFTQPSATVPNQIPTARELLNSIRDHGIVPFNARPRKDLLFDDTSIDFHTNMDKADQNLYVGDLVKQRNELTKQIQTGKKANPADDGTVQQNSAPQSSEPSAKAGEQPAGEPA